MNKNEKHKSHLLKYALNYEGKLVHIDDVETGNNCGCICPACKEPLMAKNRGKIKIHHFAHQSGADCAAAYETILHLLAKEKVQEAFLKAETFQIEYDYKSYCIKDRECKFYHSNCYEKLRKKFNLKEYYDSCEQELAYDNIKRRSDLKIFSSQNTNREPVYIEFCVTHASEEEKLHSGSKIIECLIEREEDIDNIVINGFVEDAVDKYSVDNYSFDEYESLTQKIHFYGFKNEGRSNRELISDMHVYRFVLFVSGKSICNSELYRCNENKRSRRSSLYEICFYIHPLDDMISEIIKFAKYKGYEVFRKPNCELCKNYVVNDENRYVKSGKICRLYKVLQFPFKVLQNFDTAVAKTCGRFELNQEESDRLLKGGCRVPYKVMWCDERYKHHKSVNS